VNLQFALIEADASGERERERERCPMIRVLVLLIVIGDATLPSRSRLTPVRGRTRPVLAESKVAPVRSAMSCRRP